ncbi:hypothetical protein BJV74DRAFT_853791 [Russula compacta]|nr:hypothetical protein BJV74DRAFT_853791 [Russula compacta]
MKTSPTPASDTSAASLTQQFQLTEAEPHRLKYRHSVGVSACINQGKTTLTECILCCTSRIRDVHEVVIFSLLPIKPFAFGLRC